MNIVIFNGEEIDRRIYGMMIIAFCRQEFFNKDDKTKNYSEEEKFEAIVGLLEKGALCVKDIGHGQVTIVPANVLKQFDTLDTIDFSVYHGRYKELAKLQDDFEKWEEENE